MKEEPKVVIVTKQEEDKPKSKTWNPKKYFLKQKHKKRI